MEEYKIKHNLLLQALEYFETPGALARHIFDRQTELGFTRSKLSSLRGEFSRILAGKRGIPESIKPALRTVIFEQSLDSKLEEMKQEIDDLEITEEKEIIEEVKDIEDIEEFAEELIEEFEEEEIEEAKDHEDLMEVFGDYPEIEEEIPPLEPEVIELPPTVILVHVYTNERLENQFGYDHVDLYLHAKDYKEAVALEQEARKDFADFTNLPVSSDIDESAVSADMNDGNYIWRKKSRSYKYTYPQTLWSQFYTNGVRN